MGVMSHEKVHTTKEHVSYETILNADKIDIVTDKIR